MNPTLLERHPLLPPDQLARISRAREVESGQVAVYRGRQTFATLSGGELFGELSLLGPAAQVVETLSDRLRRANAMLSSVDMLAGSVV